MLAKAAQVASDVLLANMDAVAFCDSDWGGRRAGSVARGNLSRNAFLATEVGSCWIISSCGDARRAGAAICRDRRGDKRGRRAAEAGVIV